jgi:1-acyl-sn-glycerol-3-phosphate acyltransferase
MKIVHIIRGVLVCILLLVCSLFFALAIIIFAGLIKVIPNKKWRHTGTAYLQNFPIWWMDANSLILKINSGGKLIFKGKGELKQDGWYMVVSNHQTWVDILIISLALHRRVPILKFFMKKQLLWSLPVVGLACYVLGYPFMQRHTRDDIRKHPELKNKDIETTHQACQKFKEHPTSVISFAEGTRFTAEKHEKQASPYENLLKPRPGGTAIVVSELGDKLDGLIDTTIFYDKPGLPFWDFACGNFKKIIVEYELLELDSELFGNYYEDRAYRARFAQWLNQLWLKKDERVKWLKDNEK